jgi:MFS family permease
MSIFMIFLSAGKLVLGIVYDRFGVKTGNTLISLFCLGFPIFAYFSYIPVMPWVYAVFIGMASCAVSIPIPILINRYFGGKDFPAIFSFYMMISAFAPSISIPAMGAVYDLTGSYSSAWIAFFFFSVIIAGCLTAVEIIQKRK